MDDAVIMRIDEVARATARSAASVSAPADALRQVVLVEGESDRAAIIACAAVLGRDLDAHGVTVIPMGGATNLPHFLAAVDPGAMHTIAGLIDAPEEALVLRCLQQAGALPDGAAVPIEDAGFFSCSPDLEWELIRALGIDRAIGIVGELGEGRSFALMRGQPAQRMRAADHQLHRFIGSGAGRKSRVATAFARAVAPERVPRPIVDLLDVTAPAH